MNRIKFNFFLIKINVQLSVLIHKILQIQMLQLTQGHYVTMSPYKKLKNTKYNNKLDLFTLAMQLTSASNS